MNRYEKKEAQREKLARNMRGEGLFVYRNNTKADLYLPKPTVSGLTHIGPGQEFQGDSYFKMLVGSGLVLVRELSAPVQAQIQPAELEVPIMENQKLILDQPDVVTEQGKVEHVVKSPVPLKPLKEQKKEEEVLLVEDPLAGVEILAD